MPLEQIFKIMFPVFIGIALGFILGKFKTIKTKPVVDFVLYVTVPCLIISSILKNPLPLSDFVVIPSAVIFIIFATGLITYAVLKLLKINPTPGIFIGTMFTNSGIMAFPIMLSAYGSEALTKTIVFDATNGALIFSLGVFLLVGRNNAGQIFKLPVLYAIIAATLMNLFSISIPEIMTSSLAMIGNATIPMMLLILGYQLNHIKPKTIGLSALAGTLRLSLGFLLSILLVSVFNITGITRIVIILTASMPTAINAFVLTEEYNVDADLAAGTVLFTTALSFITIPLILYFVI